MAHHVGLRKCLSQNPKEETFGSSTIIFSCQALWHSLPSWIKCSRKCRPL